MVRLDPDQWRGHAAMLVFSGLVAGSFSLGHVVANAIAPQAITAVRFVAGTAVIGALMLITRRARRRDFRAGWRYLVLGALFALYFVFMFEGLKTARPVSAAAVFTLMPLMVAIAGYAVLRQVTTPRMAAALAVAALGALWVIFRGDPGALARLDLGRGEAIYLVGCASHAVYTPMARKLNRGESAVSFSFGTLAAGSLLLVAVGFGDLVATDWAALPAMVWITLGYLVVFSTAASFVLLQYATLRLPAAKVMAYNYLTPSWVILWEAVLGNGWPGAYVVLGVATTTVALVLLLKDEGGG